MVISHAEANLQLADKLLSATHNFSIMPSIVARGREICQIEQICGRFIISLPLFKRHTATIAASSPLRPMCNDDFARKPGPIARFLAEGRGGNNIGR